jgi:hypothetical protein
MSNLSRQLLSALDADEVARLCNVGPHAISAAKKNGIPASWHRIIKTLCSLRGIPCPDEAFTFKWAKPADPKQTEGAA